MDTPDDFERRRRKDHTLVAMIKITIDDHQKGDDVTAMAIRVVENEIYQMLNEAIYSFPEHEQAKQMGVAGISFETSVESVTVTPHERVLN